MKSQRQLQVGETIKRIISDIFLRDDILSVPGSHITILEADTSPNLKDVKIFIDIYGNEHLHKQITKALNDATPYFRRELSKKVNLRTVPEITFILDKTEEKAMNIESIINSESKKYKEDE